MKPARCGNYNDKTFMQIETHSSCTRHDHARSRVTGPLLGLLAGFFLTSLACAEAENLGRKAEVTASSEKDSFSPTNVVDGEVSDPSRWLADSGDGRPWLELRFEEAVEYRGGRCLFRIRWRVSRPAL
jgi:hypothetical protein